MHVSVLAVSLVSIIFAFSFVTAQSNFACSNPSPATQAQVTASNGGLTLGQMVCSNDAQLAGITNDAGAAKAYLLSIASSLRNSQAPPDKAHIDPLNNSFATCAAKFLKAYLDAYKEPVYVVSAFRCGPNSPASINCDRSENGRAGGAGGSNHQYGIALDINPAGGNSSYETLRSFAQANPGYGVSFPWPFYNGSTDKNHMQAADKSNPSCSGVNGTPITPGPGTSTGAPLDQQIRQALGQQPQLPPQPPLPPQPQLPPQAPLPAQPQLAPQPTLPPQPTSLAQPVLSSDQTPLSSYFNLKGGAGNLGTATASTSATSTFGLIDQYANPSSDSGSPVSASIDIGSAFPIDLNQNTQDTLAKLRGIHPSSTSSNEPADKKTIQVEKDQIPQQTFTSTDLAGSPPSPQAGARSSFIGVILENIKSILLDIISYLRPFGRPSIDNLSVE